MTRLDVNSGACGFCSRIRVEKTEQKGKLHLHIETDCEMVKRMATELAVLDSMATAFTHFLNNPVYKAAATNLKHVACPVPGAIIKALEVEAGFAVPKEITMKFKK